MCRSFTSPAWRYQNIFRSTFADKAQVMKKNVCCSGDIKKNPFLEFLRRVGGKVANQSS